MPGQEKLDYPQFLELVLSDEVERRDHEHLENRLQGAGFEEECTLERFDWYSEYTASTSAFNGAVQLAFHRAP